jgi:Ca2+-binding RTX toxin-like protein
MPIITNTNSEYQTGSVDAYVMSNGGVLSVFGTGHLIANAPVPTSAVRFGFPVDAVGTYNYTLNVDGTVASFSNGGKGVNVLALCNLEANIGTSGFVSGIDAGIHSTGLNAAIYNSGMVSSVLGNAIYKARGALLVNNTGLISSAVGDAISIDTTVGNLGGSTIDNYGIISGINSDAIFSVGLGAVTIRNSGEIRGAVTLGAGADVVLNMGAGFVEGVVSLGGGADRYIGGDSNDKAFGGDGADVINGGRGADTLSGGRGIDLLTGGTGPDTFVFDIAAANADRDTIADFSVGEDKLAFDNDIFLPLGDPGFLEPEPLDPALFKSFTAALPGVFDADDRVLYNAVTGVLYYDTNGAVGGGWQVVAKLTGAPVLTAADIIVI